MKKTAAVILAAGQGTRMHSALPKVLHPLNGKPMLWHVMQPALDAGSEKPVVIIGNGADQVKDAIGEEAAYYAIQTEQLGTGHATQQAEASLKGNVDQVLVMYGDMPCWRVETLRQIIATQAANSGPMTMATIIVDDPRGFGRVERDAQGKVLAIVEEAQCTDAQKKIQELNVGLYCFEADWLWEALRRIKLSPKGEYYLTDTVQLAVQDGGQVLAIPIDDPDEAIGVNTRVHLSEAEAVLRKRINHALMESGVSMMNPEHTYIEAGVRIGKDTILRPGTWIKGDTVIGEGCDIGPNTIITDSQVGNHTTILSSVLDKAIIEDHVEIGPFARLRPGAHLADHVHMGNFGEVKNSYLAEGVKMGHFSYIGDTQVGKDVNIGCGTITCNYDGKHKNKTIIGDNTFIGSGTMLVAPLKIGSGSYTGAGSVVTHDVEDKTVVVGVPARKLREVKDSD
ncbi:MAG: bifunctional UDP-N-acetylglucosamine diphosphorylase/glucosamine-1-phosphate N-acetyltransferase GlmU [Anaerolineae bacterium]|jgi:bifunctional UDP-N-acetylglucosamine pyrophosphorylase/glucosamine-1-phosphate N-acetyltransferase|nr:bifunctional UDP-N-acetylglucosamine diphosphorylase/glucosamine-1-phosphate N-acetyltransferase GlmU [Anaerolineae bacterium]